jgi:hypothetical protein
MVYDLEEEEHVADVVILVLLAGDELLCNLIDSTSKLMGTYAFKSNATRHTTYH